MPIPIVILNPTVGYKVPQILYAFRQRPSEFNLEEIKARLRDIRKYSIERLDLLIQRLKDVLHERYPEVELIHADDAKDVVKVLKRICDQHKKVSINKSNTVEQLRELLIQEGFEIDEAYYREFEGFIPTKGRRSYWQMLRGVTFEAKWRSFVSTPFSWDGERSTEGKEGEVVLLGVSAISAEDGTVFFTEHSRNITRGLSEASHVVLLVGLEKIVRNREDALFQARCTGSFGFEAISSELNLQSVEQDLSIGRRRLGSNTRVYVILIDDGRKAVRERDDFKELLYCIGCRTCNAVCPLSYTHEAYEGPRFWLKRFNEAFKGARGLGETWVCTTCRSCEVHCPLEIRHANHAVNMRKHLVKEGRGPLPPHARFGKSVKENRNPYLEPHEKRFAWLKERLPQRAKMIYFVGCTACYRQHSIAESTVKIFKSLGLNFSILGQEEWCCGSPLIRTGQWDIALEVAKHNVDVINNSGVELVITSCAGCYITLSRDYDEVFNLKIIPKVLHTAELLHPLLEEGKLKFTKELNMVVTYHDPCHLSRSRAAFLPERERPKVYEPPRAVLEAIPRIKFVEMPRNRDEGWCCGAGGGVKAAFAETAVRTALERVKEAEEVKAQALITACPFCVRNLQDATREYDRPIEVLDLTEIITRLL